MRSCQLYVSFPDGKEPLVYLVLIYTECRTRQRPVAWASSRRWELASHAPSSEVTWSRFFPTVELPHPSWIQCQSKLSLFFSGRFFYLAQHVDTSVVLECKMFFSNVWWKYFRKHFGWKEKPDCEISFLPYTRRTKFGLNLALGFSVPCMWGLWV